MSISAVLKRKFPYPLATATVYWNSIFLGACMVVLTLNAEDLSVQWGLTDSSGIFFIISALGIGKCIGEISSGLFSDKFGRRLTLLVGCTVYALYMLMMAFITDMTLAFILTVIAGLAHSCIDNAIYPTAAESVPSSPDSATVALKMFMSFGSILVPVVLVFIINHSLNSRFIFIFFFIFALVSTIGTLFAQFPRANQVLSKQGIVVDEQLLFKEKPRVYPEGLCCIIMGATTYSTFYIAQQSLKSIGMNLGMSGIEAAYLLSIYSTGAIFAVVSLLILLRCGIKAVTILQIFPVCSIVAHISLYAIATPEIARICAFAIGFFAAGGIFQLIIATIIQLFPKRKGFYGSLVSFTSSFTMFIAANIVGYYVKTDVMQLLLIGCYIAGISVICAVILNYRYHRIIQ